MYGPVFKPLHLVINTNCFPLASYILELVCPWSNNPVSTSFV